MPKYRLLALDMDGTLLDDEQRISPENREWIGRAREAGVTVIFATGRGYQSLLPYAEELNLDSPIVAVNGSEIWRRPGELHERHPLGRDDVRQLYALALRHDVWYWAYSTEGVFNRETWTNDVDSYEWLKFGYYTENGEKLSAILDQLNRWGGYEITNSHPCNLEVNPRGVSKASGLRAVCGLLGIELSETIVAGDSLNDIAMIREAGFGVAMGNAQDAVKAAADAVTGTNAEHGVAQLIRTYILND
ncbi:HAD family hydrolase [Paenibacillus thermoaerophilus]|uniref:HAD family hydrolase n=1 Tax=Paenibacillus thermoaerophilus TaxID=1215385 RepID=A0ABW2V4C1_9BACL|nr:HAD family hydrolase [Paenibacillus thermoaerophilus]TMV18415.1 HAD family phosphatase [Paenibacillus thermoaerophilus]